MQDAAFQEFIGECVRRHLLTPEISPEEHLAAKRSQLECEVNGKILVYLDTNHWVNLQHVMLNNRKMLPSYVTMSEQLSELRRRGKIFCPINTTLFEELKKQSDPTTRSASAQIMDALSGGVCLLNWLELADIEWSQHVHRVLHATPEPHFSIFTKSGTLGGEHLSPALSLSLCNAPTLSKVFIDIRWKMTFDDCQFWPGWIPVPEEFIREGLDILAREKAMLVGDGASFDEARRASLRGWLAPFENDFSRKMPALSHGVPGTSDDHMKRILGDLVRNPGAMPSFQVLAGLDAAIISSNRELNANDMQDFMHAAVAVPYCDAFFCDKHIASLLSTKPLQLDRVYDTKILSRPEQINTYLTQLINS
jgi:hypothetical protein